MAMLAAMRQLLEEKRRLEKETTTDDAWATRPGPGASDLAPGLGAAVAAAEKFAAEARTPLLPPSPLTSTPPKFSSYIGR